MEADLTVKKSDYDFGPVHAALRRCVDADLFAGMSLAVLAGRDLVDLHCVGWADREARTPLRADHIFRVFSNTKLVTTCAAMLLFEEGRFKLDDPVETYLPQLANRRVLRPGATALDDTEPARSPITIRHLMTHTSGLSYGVFDPGTPIFKAYSEGKVLNPRATLAEMIDALGPLPLLFHPGTSWEYSVATDVVSRLVELISGQPFDRFIRERVLDPLGMVDTGFVVPEQSRERLTAYYAGADPVNQLVPGLTRIDDSPYPGAYLRPVPKLSGGGGLVSTLPDMLALLRSLLPGGPTLLQPKTIELMTINQLPDGRWLRFPNVGEIKGRAISLAGGLIVEPSPLDHDAAKGELYWGGVAGTQWWISRRTNTAGVLMTQRQMSFAHPSVPEIKRLVYQAVSRKEFVGEKASR